MKIVALRTYSLSCDPIIDPLRAMGHEVIELTFHNPHAPKFPHETIPGIVGEADFAFSLGQNDDGGGHVPPVEVYAEASERRPLVHICCDGSEKVWWPQLETYRVGAPKMFHVNIDGVKDGFFNSTGWTTLCPLDPDPFLPHMVEWTKRPISVGFCGGFDTRGKGYHPRSDRLIDLFEKKLVHAVCRPFGPYDDFRGFMGTVKVGWNHAHSGDADHMQVKARVMETAFAGAVLMEPRESPTAQYFDFGLDYLSYETDEDIAAHKAWIEGGVDLSAMARRMRERACDLYSAQRFWPKVFKMVGL